MTGNRKWTTQRHVDWPSWRHPDSKTRPLCYSHNTPPNNVLFSLGLKLERISKHLGYLFVQLIHVIDYYNGGDDYDCFYQNWTCFRFEWTFIDLDWNFTDPCFEVFQMNKRLLCDDPWFIGWIKVEMNTNFSTEAQEFPTVQSEENLD